MNTQYMTMHPRNPYAKKKPDFAALCKKYPTLEQYKIRRKGSHPSILKENDEGKDVPKESLTGTVHVDVEEKNYAIEEEYYDKRNSKTKVSFDFKESGAVYELTKILLLEDFGIKWSLSEQGNNLCPALTRSLNYLLWIEDLLSILVQDNASDENSIHGIDIGTGASCIFPLLGCSLHQSWTFTGTDIDEKALQNAEKNLVRNNMCGRVKLHIRNEAQNILPKTVLLSHCEPGPKISQLKSAGSIRCFTMCNPPFFESRDHAMETQYCNSSFQGTENEIWTKQGGEVGFIKKMISETVEDREIQKCCLFTSMVGIRKNLDPIIEFLKSKQDITFIRATTLRQGRTYRWAIAWAFVPDPSTLFVPTPTEQKKRSVSEMENMVLHSCPRDLKTTLKGMKQEFTTSLGEEIVLQRIEESMRLRYADRCRTSSYGNLILYETDTTSPSSCGRLVLVCDVQVMSFEDHGMNTTTVTVTLLDEYGSDRKQFHTFAHRLQADIERINRFWRRRQKMKLEN